MGAKNNTRKDIMINGQPTLELDYGCCMPSLMYAQRGIEPLGDIYQIDGFNREIVKIAFMRAINNKGKGRAINSLKKAIQKEYPELEDLVDCEALMERIVDQHLFISDLFFQKYGNFLMSLESDICELILKTLTSEGICCLSIHDSFIVQKVYERRLRKVMVESFRQIMDVPYTPLIK